LKLLIFDSTFGEAWVDALTTFFRSHKEPRPRFRHIYDAFGRDLLDDVWIPRFAETECVIVSGDLGRKQPRLPEICLQYNKTHILLSGTLQNSNSFNKARAIIYLWPDIAQAFDCPKGCRFQINAANAEHNRFRWVKKN